MEKDSSEITPFDLMIFRGVFMKTPYDVLGEETISKYLIEVSKDRPFTRTTKTSRLSNAEDLQDYARDIYYKELIFNNKNEAKKTYRFLTIAFQDVRAHWLVWKLVERGKMIEKILNP